MNIYAVSFLVARLTELLNFADQKVKEATELDEEKVDKWVRKVTFAMKEKWKKKIIWIILAEPSSKIFFWVTYLLLRRTSLRYSACLPTSWTLPNRKRIKLVWIDFYASMTAARPQRYIHLPFINSDQYAIISLRNSMLHHGM